MSDADPSGFGKFVPGFDFLQNLAKGASGSMPQMPNLGSWVAPTLNAEELDKRIEELKNVQFWLEQNSRALAATIQALEVQKMTLATLRGMNFNIADVTNAFKFKPAEPAPAAAPTPPPPVYQAPPQDDEQDDEPDADVDEEPDAEDQPDDEAPASEAPSKPAAKMVDPLQLWGSLAQQFQQIAASAMKDVSAQSAVDLGRAVAAGMAKAATQAAPAAGKKAVPKKPAAKKTVARKPPTKKAAASKAPAGRSVASKPAAKKAVAKKPVARGTTSGRWSGR